MKQAKLYVVKLPIAFPCLITKIILRQYPTILNVDKVQSNKPLPLSFNYKLFVGTHVQDIMINKMNYEESAGTSGPLPKGTKK
jgi:hypothetical protein